MPQARHLDRAALRDWPLPPLDGSGDKDVRGSLLVVAGSAETPGAAILAASAVLRAGAGKLVIATAPAVALAIAVAVPEARVIGLDRTPQGLLTPAVQAALRKVLGRADAVLIGPGLANDATSVQLARDLMAQYAERSLAPRVVLDAAALAAVVGHAGAPVLVTPHAGEMAHLTGADKSQTLDAADAIAVDAARRWQAVVALKGAVTWIAAPDGRLWRHAHSNPGLAMSGSGDVLAGIMAGLAARGASLEQAAAWGAVLHAQAGQRLASRCGGLGFLARELPGEIPALLETRVEPADLEDIPNLPNLSRGPRDG